MWMLRMEMIFCLFLCVYFAIYFVVLFQLFRCLFCRLIRLICFVVCFRLEFVASSPTSTKYADLEKKNRALVTTVYGCLVAIIDFYINDAPPLVIGVRYCHVVNGSIAKRHLKKRDIFQLLLVLFVLYSIL